jgi:hypothetical protein
MPGTLNNDNFRDDDSFDRYLTAINGSAPPIRFIGITDYFVLDSYEKLLAAKLPHVKLLFPNIELRFSVNAQKGSPINVEAHEHFSLAAVVLYEYAMKEEFPHG